MNYAHEHSGELDQGGDEQTPEEVAAGIKLALEGQAKADHRWYSEGRQPVEEAIRRKTVPRDVVGVMDEVNVVDILVTPRLNSRKTHAHALADAALDESLASIGLLHPVAVERIVYREPYHYSLIAGYRRVESVKRLGWAKVPAMVFHDLDAKQRTEVMAEENARRVDLQGWDRADFCKLLLVRGYDVTTICRYASEGGIPVSVAKVREYAKITSLPREVLDVLRRHSSGVKIAVQLCQTRFAHAGNAEAIGSVPTHLLTPYHWDEVRQLEAMRRILDGEEIVPRARISSLSWQVRVTVAEKAAKAIGGDVLRFFYYLTGQAPLPSIPTTVVGASDSTNVDDDSNGESNGV